MEIFASLLSYWWLFVLVLLVVFNRFFFGVVRIPVGKMGLVNKKFDFSGKRLPKGSIVALAGEAGYQADTLAPGLYFWFFGWQYSIDIRNFTTIEQGNIGQIVARDGTPLPADRILAKYVDCDTFQDARKFLTNGGQRGRQYAVVLAGTYRINTLLFDVTVTPITSIPSNQVGIVTTMDGKPLPAGEVAGKEVKNHDNFQNFDKFIDAGGSRGLQEQVLLSGSWNLNPWAVAIKVVPMVDIAIGFVGVVNSFVGDEGVDTSGEEFEHGNIVSKGQKGVWKETLGPGKYAVNPLIMSVEIVPTTNIVLNWADTRTESHELDANLCSITVRSKDGFTFNLDVSQIIHVSSVEAPKVIARFGSMKNLVSQVLEPTIGNYFRNSAQGSDVIEFLTKRSDRQEDAKTHISSVLNEYNVKAVDTLIGDITPPAPLMETLTNRKLADENEKTYQSQQKAQMQRQELTKQTALADIQPEVVKSERGIQIAENQANAAIKQAEGNAKSVELNAGAEAKRITLTGEAEATKIQAIGEATAKAYELQVDAMTADNFTRLQVVNKLADGKVRIMPDTLITGGGSGSGGSSILDGLLALFLNQQSAKANEVTKVASK